MKKIKIICSVFAIFVLVLSYNVSACKDIVATGDTTEGDYNLLMKVRDPSRPGLQVLTIVPEGYQYNYHDSKTGKTIRYTTTQKYIGVATKDDTIPNVVKAGMALSGSGIAYGDADSGSGWVNYRRNAWDDFDWIRYACQKAETEEEAVNLLTEAVVDEMHAPGVSENLFVVGPNTGYVIEADAYRYDVKEIKNDVAVMSNYPKDLWKTQKLERLTISRNFDTVVEKTVRKNSVVRLGGLYGIKIVSIDDGSISVKPVHLLHKVLTQSIGIVTEIPLGYSKTVGDFRVTLLSINGRKAYITVSNLYKAWEEKLLEKIAPMNGSISVGDMMHLSRLHESDMDDLRPMCEDYFEYEGVAIYKIPKQLYNTLSMGWFSPNHACSSIYVPFHICDTDIYDPYETGEAAQLSLDLLNIYGHDDLSYIFSKTETVFLNEMESAEEMAKDLLLMKNNVSEFLTIIDAGMQKQAFLTQEMWAEASTYSEKESIIRIIGNIWEKDYQTTLTNMRYAISNLDRISNSNFFKEKITDIAQDICKSKISSAKSIGKEVENPEEMYNEAEQLINQGKYDEGFYKLEKSYVETNEIINGNVPVVSEYVGGKETRTSVNFMFYVLIILLILILLVLLVIILARKRKHN